MNKTNNTIEVRIENIRQRIEILARDVDTLKPGREKIEKKTRLENYTETFNRLMDNRDNQILTNKVGTILDRLEKGKSVTITPVKLVNATTLDKWSKIEVQRSFKFGNTIMPSVCKTIAEANNLKEMLHTIRSRYAVESLGGGKFSVTRIADKVTDAGFTTPDDMIMFYFGITK